MGEMNENRIREVVDNLISHPSFRRTLSNILNQSVTTTAASDTPHVHQSDPTSTGSTNSLTNPNAINDTSSVSATTSTSRHATPVRYTTPNEEFSALFRQGGSSRGSVPQFQRGISHRQSATARARRRVASVPYARVPTSSRPARKDIFRSKEVILLPDSKADRIVRPQEKANLMERGFVLSKTKIDKSWSDKEVFQHLNKCFEEKLKSEDFSSVEVGASTISTRFEILLGVGSSLRKPCLSKDQVLDGALISRLFTQKIIWLRPFNDLPCSSRQMKLDDLFEDDPPNETINEENTGEDQERYAEAISKLAEFYPDKQHSDLLSALTVSKGCTEEAAQLLLDVDEPGLRYSQLSFPFPSIDVEQLGDRSGPSSSSTNVQVSSSSTFPHTFPSSSLDRSGASSSSTNDQVFSNRTFPNSSSPSSLDSDHDLFLISYQSQSPHDILQNFSTIAIDTNEDIWLDVKREDLWCICLAFYKLAIKHPDRLKKNLCVKFIGSGELGIDAGALRNEFFSMCFDEVVKRLFEGNMALIPRRGIGSKSIQFQVVGALIAHSVLQGGPGFPVLAKWVVNYILGDDPSTLPISKEFITLSEMTSSLLELIGALDEAKTQEQLNYILEAHPKSASFWEVINSSEWSCTEVINIANKGCLVHELIYNELVRRRKDQLDSLCKGLESSGFLRMLKMHHNVADHVLSYHVLELTSEIFTSFLKSHPNSNAEKQAYQWLLDYIIASSDCVNSDDFPQGKLNTLLKFSTGLWNIPPIQKNIDIHVKFLDDDDDEKLPKAGACSNILHIPTVHSSKQAFYRNMDVALKYGHSGFTEH